MSGNRSRLAIAGFLWIGLLSHVGVVAAGGAAGQASEFDTRIAPLLARNCAECHNPSNPQGGLDLTRLDAARRGGQRGPALVPGKPEESWLWKRVDTGQMPPGRPLPAGERALLKGWISRGGQWGSAPVDPYRYSSERRAGYDWWSLQPVRFPPAQAHADTADDAVSEPAHPP